MQVDAEDLHLTLYSIDNTSQMIYWLQPDGRFIYANKAFCEKSGYTIAELKSMRLTDLEPKLTFAGWKQRWQKLKQAGTLELEVIRKTKSGEPMPVLLHLNYLQYKGREYNLAFASDLRNKKKMERVLQNRLEEIEALHRQLEEYEFPGNVRELENLIERAVILSPGKTLAANFQFKKSTSGGKAVFKTMDAMQREHILDALRRSNGQVTGKGGAASLLGMHDKTLYSRMQKLGIRRHDYTK